MSMRDLDWREVAAIAEFIFRRVLLLPIWQSDPFAEYRDLWFSGWLWEGSKAADQSGKRLMKKFTDIS